MELENFGSAANKLADILKDAAGIIIDPAKKFTNSQVEMYIEKKRAKHVIEIEKIELVERAKLRILETEIRRQNNLEAIGYHATLKLPPHAKPEDIDIDWLHHFTDNCKDVGEEELRKIWAEILCKEATDTGQFSKRTISALKNFSIQDCKLFNLCSKYISNFDNGIFFIINPTEVKNYDFFSDSDLSYREFLHMSHLNLISDDNIASFSLDPNEIFVFKIQNKKIHLKNETLEDISQQYIIVTDIGMELMNVITPLQDIDYIESIKKHLANEGFTVTEERI